MPDVKPVQRRSWRINPHRLAAQHAISNEFSVDRQSLPNQLADFSADRIKHPIALLRGGSNLGPLRFSQRSNAQLLQAGTMLRCTMNRSDAACAHLSRPLRQ
jgi:hypothetical protein